MKYEAEQFKIETRQAFDMHDSAPYRYAALTPVHFYNEFRIIDRDEGKRGIATYLEHESMLYLIEEVISDLQKLKAKVEDGQNRSKRRRDAKENQRAKG